MSISAYGSIGPCPSRASDLVDISLGEHQTLSISAQESIRPCRYQPRRASDLVDISVGEHRSLSISAQGSIRPCPRGACVAGAGWVLRHRCTFSKCRRVSHTGSRTESYKSPWFWPRSFNFCSILGALFFCQRSRAFQGTNPHACAARADVWQSLGGGGGVADSIAILKEGPRVGFPSWKH